MFTMSCRTLCAITSYGLRPIPGLGYAQRCFLSSRSPLICCKGRWRVSDYCIGMCIGALWTWFCHRPEATGSGWGGKWLAVHGGICY